MGPMAARPSPVTSVGDLRLPRRRVYTWAGHGNLGDDWIFDVAGQHVEARLVRERRSVRRGGRHVLDDVDPALPLLLWGGGWLAADRPGADTLRRWSRHLAAERRPVRGFGLGVGPFGAARPDDERALAGILGAVDALVVRTAADLDTLPPGAEASLGCDVALLDRRFAPDRVDRLGTGARSGRGLVLALPAWRDHWLLGRPWLTESAYRDLVERAVRDAGPSLTQVIFDSGSDHADERYWSYLGGDVLRPADIMEAAAAFTAGERVLAGRLHAGVLAAVLGMPALVVGYHHKFGVLEELGMHVVGTGDLRTAEVAWQVAEPEALAQVRRRGASALGTVLS